MIEISGGRRSGRTSRLVELIADAAVERISTGEKVFVGAPSMGETAELIHRVQELVPRLRGTRWFIESGFGLSAIHTRNGFTGPVFVDRLDEPRVRLHDLLMMRGLGVAADAVTIRAADSIDRVVDQLVHFARTRTAPLGSGTLAETTAELGELQDLLERLVDASELHERQT